MNLIFIRCGNAERKIANVAVTDVQLAGRDPAHRTRVPFEVTLKNTGREPLRAVKVALELDGKAIEKDATQVDQIDPGDVVTVTLTGSLEDAGPRLIAVHVEGDGLDGDNVLYKVVGVRDKVRVLLVAHPFAGQNVTDGGDWFARKALIPFDAERDRDKIERYFIETQAVAPNEAGVDLLANKDICYLLNAAARHHRPARRAFPGVRHAAHRVREAGRRADHRVRRRGQQGRLQPRARRRRAAAPPTGRRAEHHRSGAVRAVGE